MERAFHQRADKAFARHRGRAARALARRIGAVDDLESGRVDARRPGRAQDRLARADQHRLRKTRIEDAGGRIQRGDVARMDQADARPRSPRVLPRPGGQRFEARVHGTILRDGCRH